MKSARATCERCDTTASRRGSVDADLGYTTVGFRLLREVDTGVANTSPAQ